MNTSFNFSKYYSRLFGNKDALNRYLRMQNIVPVLKDIKCCKVLDVGCLDGHFTGYLLNQSNTIYAVDIYDYGAKKKHPEIVFTLADAHHLPYNNASVDFIFCSDVFEHVEEFENFCAEFSRVLRPGGRCLVSTVSGVWSSPLNIRKWVMRYLPLKLGQRIMGRFYQEDNNLHRSCMGHVRFDITPDKLEDIFQDNGLATVKRVEYCGGIGSLLMEIFYSFNDNIRYGTFPILQSLLPLDRLFSFGPYWQFYLLLEKE